MRKRRFIKSANRSGPRHHQDVDYGSPDSVFAGLSVSNLGKGIIVNFGH
jgi:hypothetical protein